ncbi:MAG: Sulfite dehydrogenase (quinone), iron-sulfur subunit SoeB [Rhodanobacteraceae bacterium]|jgi:Fe-S-cluster-containing dehydrogenase component|nr:MAG: Sulfite dehydrogenase (quinone), iron-sulfur subunit SoeB [Rhodanobacteraceae bacterium]
MYVETWVGTAASMTMTSLPAPAKKKLGLVIDLDICVGCHACAVACKEWNDGGDFGTLADDDPYGAEPSGVWFNRVHGYEITGLGTRDSGLVQHAMPQPDFDVAHVQAGDTKKSDLTEDSSCRVPSPEFRVPQMVHFPRSCLHCETPDCVTVCPTGASYKRAEDGIVLVDEDKCIGCQLCAWACPYGAREIALPHPKKATSDMNRKDSKRGTMQKCTLCVDRIYNETLDERDRQPACVLACPTRARMFGDLGDPDSEVSQVVKERGGFALMPEFGYQPVNRYLPPRPRRDGSHATTPVESDKETLDASHLPPLLRWLDKALSR